MYITPSTTTLAVMCYSVIKVTPNQALMYGCAEKVNSWVVISGKNRTQWFYVKAIRTLVTVGPL